MASGASSPSIASDRAGSAIARYMPLWIALVAIGQLVPAVWIVVSPHGFFEQIGPFGPYNAHYLGDAAAFQGGLGLALLASLAWPALRAGALAATLAVSILHAFNHWLDVGEAHAGSNAGLGDAISLTVLAILVAGLVRESMRGARA
jgi:hypothetical protein